MKGKIAFVTGAGSGIGRATAICLLEQGARVHAADRDERALRALVHDLGSGRVHTWSLDVTDRVGTRDAIDAAAADSGGLDVLVCSAGVVLASDEERVKDPAADWNRCLGVNLHGTVHACEAAAPHLGLGEGGSIVTLGSISAHSARHSGGPYPVSKAAALLYTKSLALGLAPAVRVNAVCPGAVWTGMQERIAAEIQKFTGTDAPDDETTFFARYIDITPMKRPQSVTDVAKAIVFLASSDAANITGQCLHVDGGTIVRD
jgi:NAD(P)-dependent dehydrogenase (short-subunit alcohol dehydrogenase family)